jgi:hypothetical protein
MNAVLSDTIMTSQPSPPSQRVRRIIQGLAVLTLPLILLAIIIAIAVNGGWRPMAQGELFTSSVQAYRQWQSTGFYLNPGDRVSIAANGKWSYSPTVGLHSAEGGEYAPDYYPMPNAKGGSLIGRIGENGATFYVGRYTTMIVTEAGMLYLRINDDRLGDNVGELELEIELVRPTATP